MGDLISRMIDYRAKHNLSQEKFAEKCQVCVQTICTIESGQQNPSKLTKQKILNIINQENKEN